MHWLCMQVKTTFPQDGELTVVLVGKWETAAEHLHRFLSWASQRGHRHLDPQLKATTMGIRERIFAESKYSHGYNLHKPRGLTMSWLAFSL